MNDNVRQLLEEYKHLLKNQLEDFSLDGLSNRRPFKQLTDRIKATIKKIDEELKKDAENR